MKLELLYFEGCPSHDRLLPSLRELATADGVEFEQQRIETRSDRAPRSPDTVD